MYIINITRNASRRVREAAFEGNQVPPQGPVPADEVPFNTVGLTDG